MKLTKKEMKEDQREIIASLRLVERPGIEELIGWLDTTNFYTSPASTMFHGNFEGGLARHSLMVYQEFWDKVLHYGLDVPEDAAVLAGICHDFCKIGLYEPNLLKNGNLSDSKPYKVNDTFPYGHGEKSVRVLEDFVKLTEQEAILIRWHMGPYDKEWENYEKKVLSMHPEVMLIHHADAEVSKIRSY